MIATGLVCDGNERVSNWHVVMKPISYYGTILMTVNNTLLCNIVRVYYVQSYSLSPVVKAFCIILPVSTI